MPWIPTLGHRAKEKVPNISSNPLIRLQKSMHVEEVYATWHFSIILISLRVEVGQFSDFLAHAKIFSLGKAFFNLDLLHSTLRKKNIALIFLYLNSYDVF